MNTDLFSTLKKNRQLKKLFIVLTFLWLGVGLFLILPDMLFRFVVLLMLGLSLLFGAALQKHTTKKNKFGIDPFDAIKPSKNLIDWEKLDPNTLLFTGTWNGFTVANAPLIMLINGVILTGISILYYGDVVYTMGWIFAICHMALLAGLLYGTYHFTRFVDKHSAFFYPSGIYYANAFVNYTDIQKHQMILLKKDRLRFDLNTGSKYLIFTLEADKKAALDQLIDFQSA